MPSTSAGIGVILDLVLVHFPADATGLAGFDNDSHLFECPIPDRKCTPWGTYYFDFARNEVKSFLISCLFHWIEEYYVDGFRFDAAGQFHYYEFPSEEKYRSLPARPRQLPQPGGLPLHAVDDLRGQAGAPRNDPHRRGFDHRQRGDPADRARRPRLRLQMGPRLHLAHDEVLPGPATASAAPSTAT